MPDADKHRQYCIFAPSLLALLLACLIVTTSTATASNLHARGRIDLEHNAKLNNAILHGCRQDLHSNASQSGPDINAADGPKHVAITWHEATNLMPGLKHAESMSLAKVNPPSLRRNMFSPRAPPANFAPQIGV